MTDDPKWYIVNYKTDEILETGKPLDLFKKVKKYPHGIISGPWWDLEIAHYWSPFPIY